MKRPSTHANCNIMSYSSLPGMFVRLALLTLTNPNQMREVLLFVCFKMADKTNPSSKRSLTEL